MLDENDAYEENAEKYFRNIQWINVSIIVLDLFLPCFWYIFSLPSIILLIFLPIGIGGITGLLAVEFAFERKFKQITAKFAEYIGHNTFAFILFAYSAGYFFLLKVLMNLPGAWILLGLNLVHLAFLHKVTKAS